MNKISKKMLLSVLIFLININLCVATVIINEIMYNPAGDEYDFEYIELFGKYENISGWYFEGITFKFPNNSSIDGYLVIANTLKDDGENNDFLDRYNNTSCPYEYSGTLLNSGETIILRDNKDNIVDIVTFYDWAEENHSIERIFPNSPSSDPDNWKQSNNGGSPGKKNPSSEISCDWKLSLLMNSSISDNPEWQLRAEKITGEEKANITIKHWIEDISKNRVKEYEEKNIEEVTRQSTTQKYSPTLAINKAYIIKASMNTTCKESSLENNKISSLIFIPDKKEDPENKSSIMINKISPEKIAFGDTIKVYVDIYHGMTNKYAIYSYVKDKSNKISEDTTIHLKNKLTNYSLVLPIQLKPNCENSFPEGEYILVIEGLDTISEKKIRIDETNKQLCKDIKVEKEVIKPLSGKLSYEIIDMPKTIEMNKSFDISIRFINEEDKTISFEIWSYIYRGSKRYSEEFTNLRYLSLESQEARQIKLPNILKEGEEGNYSIKIRLKKEERKTSDDKTMKISLKTEKKKAEIPETLLSAKKEESDTISEKEKIIVRKSDVVYISPNDSIRKNLPFLILISCLLAVFFSILNTQNIKK